jgi:formate dehydrogenase subunit gamma
MLGNRVTRWLACLSVAFVLAGLPLGGAAQQQDRQKEQAQRQEVQPLNNAPFWRDVRAGNANPYQTTQVRGIETNVLIQTEGQIWREIRNGPVTIYGGWLLVVVAVLIGLYYGWKGPIKLHGKPTGKVIQRFTNWDRIVHWTTAVTFVILAVTGIVILFGRYILLPVMGYTLFSWLATLSKNLHNFVGPLFIVSALALYLTYLRHNLLKSYDLTWFAKAGGMFSGEHVPSGKFNAGEKAWFWLGFILLFFVGITGLVLDFTNFGQGRGAMQLANLIHAIAALLFMAAALGHIYLGTVGVEGAYQAMRSGYVDETWAKEHHEYWYEEVKAQTQTAGGGAPSAAPASPMKEGWK